MCRDRMQILLALISGCHGPFPAITTYKGERMEGTGRHLGCQGRHVSLIHRRFEGLNVNA